MPEGTFGGDLIGITGRVVGGRRGGNFLLQACSSQKCVIRIPSLIGCPCRIFFSGSFAMQEFKFFQNMPCMNLFLFLYYPTHPPPPPFTFLMVRPYKQRIIVRFTSRSLLNGIYRFSSRRVSGSYSHDNWKGKIDAFFV